MTGLIQWQCVLVKMFAQFFRMDFTLLIRLTGTKETSRDREAKMVVDILQRIDFELCGPLVDAIVLLSWHVQLMPTFFMYKNLPNREHSCSGCDLLVLLMWMLHLLL